MNICLAPGWIPWYVGFGSIDWIKLAQCKIEKNEMCGACGAYGAGERGVQGFGGET